MKKALGIFVLSMFIISMGMGFVSAGIVEDIHGVIDSTYKAVAPYLAKIIGETEGTELFLAKILFLIIVFGVVWTALSKVDFFSENDWVLWTVSIAVSFVAVRWISGSEIINTILLPYSVLGIALTAGIPFVVYFFLTNSFKSRTLRKVSWIFFIVIFIGLWILRSRQDGVAPAVTGFAWIYLITAGLALIVLLADKTIQRTIKKSAIDANKEIAVAKRRTQLIEDRYRLEERRLNNQVTDRDYKTQDTALKKNEKKYDII